jgi:hypothetical protein
MKMKNYLFLVISFAIVISCAEAGSKKAPTIRLNGTWQLVGAIAIIKGDSTFTDYTKNQKMIKIINDTHFAFLKHDINVPKDSSINFDAGGGAYDLVGDQYTEHLDFYNDRHWQGKTFKFTVTIKGDTLIQQGLEKVEGTGINREIIEKYLKVKS